MWPFNKKKQILEEESVKNYETTLCIPGSWKSREEFILSVVEVSGGEYIAAGNILMSAKQNKHYTFSFDDRDEKMKSAFQYAGMVNRVSNEFISEIENHKHVVYISGKGGSLEEAENISRAGLVVLKAGGLGLKVETAGKAFEKNQWINFFENFDSSNLYRMLVIDSITNEEGSTFSCGMQNLGFKDTIVSGEEFQESVNLITVFSYYQIVDKPTIQDGQTFSCDIDSPKFRITKELQPPYEGNETLGNPYGMWRLSKL